jgi:hypothetical protein
MLPWNTCGDTQGLVRTFIQPSSIECYFMSQLTTELTRAGPGVFEMTQTRHPGVE